MTIRTKLTLQFVAIVALIISLSSLTIYFFSSNYREEGFYERLNKKGNSTAKLLIKVDEVDITLLEKIEDDNPGSLPKEKTKIFDEGNHLLYSSDKKNELELTPYFLNLIRTEGNVRFQQGDYEALGFVYKNKNERFIVIVAAEDIFGLKKINNLKLILLTVFSGSVILTFISAWIYSGRALKPISEVINKVNEISISKLDLRVDEGNKKDELAKLAQTFNRMLGRLESSFTTQKIFIANASHELRTPLTAITGQLDVVQLKDRSPEEYKQVLSSVLDDIKNVNNISNRLLLLAQTDVGSSKKDFTSLRIDEMVWQARTELLRHKAGCVINVVMDETIKDGSSLIIQSNEQLMKTAIVNLMDNACKYSADKRVDVIVVVKPRLCIRKNIGG